MASPDPLFAFSLEGRKIALHLSAVDIVIPSVEISPLPKAPEIVLGIISLRGRIIPVLDIRKRFRLPEREIMLSDCLIIAKTSKRTVALLADAALGLVESGSQAVPAGEILPGLEYVEGVSRIDGDMLLIHDLEGFLSLEEEKELEKSLEGSE
jgi:purine-binding chemotaxis protein CheW